MKKIYLILTAITFLTACKKEQANTGSPKTAAMQIARVEQDATNYTTYTYNTDGLLTNNTTVHNGQPAVIDLTYRTDKKVASAVFDNNPVQFVYSDDKLVNCNFFGNTADRHELTDYFTFVYTGDKITVVNCYTQSDHNPFLLYMKTLNEFNAAGDLTSQKIYLLNGTGLSLTSSAVYEYDDHPNPFAATLDFQFLFRGTKPAHNITKATTYDAGGNVSQTDTYTYTYNSNHYPIQVQVKTVKPNTADNIIVNKITYK